MRICSFFVFLLAALQVYAQEKPKTDAELFSFAFSRYLLATLTSGETKHNVTPNTKRLASQFSEIPDGLRRMAACVGEQIATRLEPALLSARIAEAKELGIVDFGRFMLGLPVYELIRPSEDHCEKAYFGVKQPN